MDSNKLIFSSKIDTEVEDICFDILNDYYKDVELESVYVKNVILAPNEIIFFADIESRSTFIRVPIEID